MKTETHNNADAIQKSLKNELLQKAYYFTIEGSLVKAVFSDSVNAPTLESALVKIAARMGR